MVKTSKRQDISVLPFFVLCDEEKEGKGWKKRNGMEYSAQIVMTELF